MDDLFQHYERSIDGNNDKWGQEWWEEMRRRSDLGLFAEEDEITKEISFGPRWICKRCKSEYRVKTPFYKLYCSECLGRLRCNRLLPRGNKKPGYWIFDDDRRRIGKQ